MEISFFVVLAVSLMFSGVYGQGGYSQSMSCSTVNGKTICNKQAGPGNSASSFADSRSAPGGSSQQVYTGTSNGGDSWQTYQSGGPFVGGFGVSSYAPNVGFFMGSQPPVFGFGFPTAGSFPQYSSGFSYSSSESGGMENPPQDSQVSTGAGVNNAPYLPNFPGFPMLPLPGVFPGGGGAFAGAGGAFAGAGAFAGR